MTLSRAYLFYCLLVKGIDYRCAHVCNHVKYFHRVHSSVSCVHPLNINKQLIMQISNILTKREREVLLTYADVGQAKRVAKRLGISQSTVESHVCNVVRKTKLNLAQLINAIAGEIDKAIFQELPTIFATNRELEVLPHICKGFSNIEIAKILGVTQRTIDTFVYWLMAKLGVISRYQLIACYKCCPEKFRSSQSLRESTSKRFKIRKMLDNGYSSSQISEVLYCNKDYISRVKVKVS